MTKLTNEDIMRIMQLDLEELWNLYISMEPENINNEHYLYVKFGMLERSLSIRKIIKKEYIENWKENRVKIKGFGIMNIDNFYDDIEQRQRMMRSFILENWTDKEQLISRITTLVAEEE